MSQDATTLRDLQLSVIAFERVPLPIPTNDGSITVHLQPGGTAYFDVGYVYTQKARGLMRDTKDLEAGAWDEAYKRSFHPMFVTEGKTKKKLVSLSIPQEMSTLRKWPHWLLFTADNMEPLVVKMTLHHDQQRDVALSFDVIN